jgi:hypothetical protein
MPRAAAIGFVIIILVLSCGPVLAQERDSSSDQTKAATPTSQENSREKASEHDNTIEPYRLDFAFNEMEDGKKTNTRRYSMNLTAGSADEIRIGTRVPVPAGPPQAQPGTNALVNTQIQYMDVGTRIWANLRRHGEGVQLEVRSEISNLDSTERHDRNTGWLPPVVRQINISGSTLLVTGKPILIGSMDDPNSVRQFQLEVTATKLR